jgi:hypothetical protein
VGVVLGLAAASVLALLAVPPDVPPEPPVTRVPAAGPMVGIPLDRVTAVDVRAGERHWRFERADGRWRAGARAAPSGFGAHVDAGLRFLHASAPQERLAAADLERAFLAEVGLDPPRYVVSARTDDARTLTVAFGAASPRGLAQYARVDDERDVLLLPRYVGEAWEAATGLH